MEKVIIIGAGPAGLTAALHFCNHNVYDVTVIEISDSVGGMSKTIKLFNRYVDIGPHRFFSKNSTVNKIWKDSLDGDFKTVNRLTRIFYNKKLFQYPIRPFNAFFKLGIKESLSCLFSYITYQIFPIKNEKIFSNWVSNRFGKKLYSIFFHNYTKKVWGISPKKISSDFAAQRIKKFSLADVIFKFLKSKNSHKTLVDKFMYPLKGNGYTYQKMHKKILKLGGKFLFKSKINKVEYKENLFKITLDNNKNLKCKYLISSMPIDSFLSIFKNYKNNQLNLKFRNTTLVYTLINKDKIFEDQWLYIQDSNISTGRITNFNNWIPDIINSQEGTVLVCEYWSFDNDKLWAYNDKKLLELCSSDLIKCNFINNKNEIIDFKVIKVPKCYPIYYKNYKNDIDEIKNELKKYKNLFLIGRGGSYKYNNQDHSILMGYLTYSNVHLNCNYNLWEVNEDSEYQES